MKDKTNILVTGGTGFVGKSIIEELDKTGRFGLFCMVRKLSEDSRTDPLNSVKMVTGDIADYQTLKGLEGLNNIEVLVHSAGLAHQFGKTVKADFWDSNVFGTENICRLAEKLKVRHLILISSVSVYGDHGNQEIDETFECKPNGFYAESKLESEKIAIAKSLSSGIGLTILRLGTVIGEGDKGNISRLITEINKRRFIWIGKGDNKKSLIYKKDVAKGVLRILEAKTEKNSVQRRQTEIYNLNAEAMTMKEIVSSISGSLKKSPLPLKIPAPLIRKIIQLNDRTFSFKFVKKIEPTIEKWLSNDIFSGKKLSEKYGFKPLTPIPEAISKQVGNFLEQKNKKRIIIIDSKCIN